MNPRRITFCAAVLVVTLSACSKQQPPQSAAVVDGTHISDAQVQAAVPQFELLADLQGSTCGGAAPGQSPPPDAEKGCVRQVLGVMIQNQVLENYASANNISVPQSKVDDTLAQIEKGEPTSGALDAEFAKRGVTREQFGDLVKKLLLFSEVQTQVTTNLDDATLRKIYDDSIQDYTTLDTAHILVKDEATAQKIKDEATTKNFAELAKKYSGDPGSKDQGGNIGAVAASKLDPGYAKAVMDATPGTIIGPVQSQFGWHVIWVKDVTVEPFEKVKADLAKSSTASGQLFQQWMTDLLTAANIDVNPRYGTFDPTTGEILPITSTSPSPAASPSAPYTP